MWITKRSHRYPDTRSIRVTFDDLERPLKVERDGPNFSGKSTYLCSCRLTISGSLRHVNQCRIGAVMLVLGLDIGP